MRTPVAIFGRWARAVSYLSLKKLERKKCRLASYWLERRLNCWRVVLLVRPIGLNELALLS